MTSRELRARAEQVVRVTRSDVAAMSKQNVQRLVRELQIHQVELEMQNEALRRTQRDLEQSQDQYQELFECAPAGYLMLDARGVIVRANTTAVMLLNVARQRLIAQPFAALVAAESLLPLFEHLDSAQRDAHRGVGSASCEVRLKAPHGLTTHVRLDTTRAAVGAAERLVVLTDISDGKRSFAELERLSEQRAAGFASRTAELESRNHQLETEMVSRARNEAKQRDLDVRLRDSERMASLGMLAAGIAHDFNNLLVSVLGSADLLLQSPDLPVAWRDSLALIKRAGRNASDLTRQLLVFAGMGRVNLAPVSLSHVVSDAVGLLRANVSSEVELDCQIDAALPKIKADRGQVHQLLMNLMTNAVEALNSPGVVTIRAIEAQLDAATLSKFQHHTGTETGPFVILQVVDSGPGIDPETVTRIFDPFFTTKFTGRGLGLATALGIVQSHRGALRVRTKPGEGTSFEVAFPLAEVRRETDRPVAPCESAWSASGSVLVIDDDDTVRSVVCQLLAALGFKVTGADGGAQGLELFRRAEPRFDLLVLDWLMPGISGEQVLRTVREIEPALPVILVSGYCTADLATYDERVARVQKPMTLADLRAAVRAVLGEVSPHDEVTKLPPLSAEWTAGG